MDMTGEPVVTGVDRWRALAKTFAVALVTTVGGALVGYFSMKGVTQDAAPGVPVSHIAFWTILWRNLGAAMMLYSGVCTVGVSTVIGGLLLGGYVGATWAAAVSAVGAASAGGSIVWYAPLEMLGLVLAAVAGLMPVVAMLGRPPTTPRLRAYSDALPTSLRMLAIAVAVLVAAAFLETLVIGSRT